MLLEVPRAMNSRILQLRVSIHPEKAEAKLPSPVMRSYREQLWIEYLNVITLCCVLKTLYLGRYFLQCVKLVGREYPIRVTSTAVVEFMQAGYVMPILANCRVQLC